MRLDDLVTSTTLEPNKSLQQNPAGFDTPLHFVFTGVGMTVSEANKERQRVARLYEAVEMGEQHFASRIQATVERLFGHVWPAIDHVSSLRLNEYLRRQGHAVGARGAAAPVHSLPGASAQCAARFLAFCRAL